MKKSVLDITGQRFGKLVVIERYPESRNGSAIWTCACDCGKRKNVRSDALRNGYTASCGCLRANQIKIVSKHGLSNTAEYRIWSGIKARCDGSDKKNHPYYGARGITVCDEWRNDFMAFYRDMGPRPSKNHSVERRDVDGEYGPNNCYWATPLEQANNRRSSVFHLYRGVNRTLSGWCRELGLQYEIVRSRYSDYGWSFEEAIGEKPRQI